MIYFVTEKFLKDETPIGENVDIKKVLPFLKTAANMRLIPVLGRLFYKDLLDKYNAQTLNTDEVELVGHVKMVVAWYASYLATPALNKQVTNKGQQRQNGDYSTSVEDQGEVKAQDVDSSVGRFYLNELKNELKIKKGVFPVYESKENKDSFLFEQPKTIEPDSYGDYFIVI